MSALDPNRMTQLVELSALERFAQGAERLQAEETVSLLLHAAYTDAKEGARADFMARVGKLPTSEWPWSAVRATAPRSAVGVGSSIGSVAATPPPTPWPPLLVLIRGQAESADIAPGNRLPDRGTPEGTAWEPLYRALDAWDTQTIVKWIGPQGWINPSGATAGQVKETGTGGPPGDNGGGKDLPVPQATGEWVIPWTHPAMIVAGAVVVVATGAVIYTYAEHRSRRRLEEALASQEAP